MIPFIAMVMCRRFLHDTKRYDGKYKAFNRSKNNFLRCWNTSC